MSTNFIEPEDVGPEHARQVLDFLNSVQTPQEIARAVEIFGEPDIGVRLAARILARRQELGRFVNLQQLADIPLIGPERFTEIVITLSGARPITAVEPTLAELHREISRLRSLISALQGAVGASSVITMQALQDRPFLGQAVNLVVQVTNAAGTRPIVDAPVTLIATWGRLRSVDGTKLREGTSLVTHTDDVGMARAILFPPTFEELLPVQQDALQAALRLLNPTAATPRDTLNGLREIARQYRWHGNPDLRAAIDIYFRDFGRGLVETINQRDYLTGWMYQEATVLALARTPSGNGAMLNGNGSSAVEVSAVLTLRFRNWLGAWVEMLQQLANQEARLPNDLRDAALSEGAGLLLSRVYTRLNDFVGEQRGMAGEFVGQRLAESSLRDFLQTGIAELPTDLQRAVLPALHIASRTVTAAGTQVMAAVGQTRTELRREIDTRGSIDAGNIAELAGRLDQLDMQVAAKVDSGEFASFQSNISNQLAAKVDTNTFTSFQQELDLRFDGKLDQTVFTAYQQELEFSLGSLVEESVFNNFQAEVEAGLAARVQETTFNDFRREMESGLATRVEQSTFNQFELEMQSGLASRVEQTTFNNFQREMRTGLESRVDATEFTAFQQEVEAGFQSTVDQSTFTNFQEAVDVRLADTVARDDLQTLGTRLDTVSGQVGELRTSTTIIGRQVNTIGSSVQRIDEDVTALRRR